jgi:hypothetical protein
MRSSRGCEVEYVGAAIPIALHGGVPLLPVRVSAIARVCYSSLKVQDLLTLEEPFRVTF